MVSEHYWMLLIALWELMEHFLALLLSHHWYSGNFRNILYNPFHMCLFRIIGVLLRLNFHRAARLGKYKTKRFHYWASAAVTAVDNCIRCRAGRRVMQSKWSVIVLRVTLNFSAVRFFFYIFHQKLPSSCLESLLCAIIWNELVCALCNTCVSQCYS